MTACRIRVGRDTAATGSFEWATLDRDGAVLSTGQSNLGKPPVTGECEVVIASDLVLLERVAAPAAQQRGVSSALRFLVEDSAIPDPERLHVAPESTPTKDALCVGIIDQQWLAQMLSRLERAGFDARSVYPECLVPRLLPRTWTVVWNGSDSFARTGEVEGFVLDRADHGDVPISLLLAVDSARKSGSCPETIVLRAAAGIPLPNTQRWTAAIGIPIKQGSVWRWADVQRQPGLDLLQGEFAPRGIERDWLRRLGRPAMLAGALLVVGSFGIAADWWAKVRERRMLVAEMHGIYRETFGEGAVVVDAPLQMSRALAELRQRSGHAGPTDFLALLGPVADRLLDPAKLRINSVSYENGTLTVSLRPHDSAPAAVLLDELRAKTPLQGLNIRVETAGETGKSTVRLMARAETTK